MRILTLVLSLYVMLLNSVACADTFKFSGNNEVTISEYNYDKHVEYCGDQCSPFCACACCVGFTSPAKVVVPAILVDFAKTPFYYVDGHFNTSRYPLLQPPRA